MGNPQIEGKYEIEIRQTLGEPMGEKVVVERIYTDKNPQEAMGGRLSTERRITTRRYVLRGTGE